MQGIDVDLLQKVANKSITMSPAMLDVVNRVKTAGMHRVVPAMLGINELSMKTATQWLGTQLLKQHQKHAAINSGLSSLAAVQGEKLATVNVAQAKEKLQRFLSTL